MGKKRERYCHWFNVNIRLLFTIIIGRMVLFSPFGHYMLPIPIPCWYKLNPSNLPSKSPIQMPSCPCSRQIISFYAEYTDIAFTATPLAWIYHLFNAPIPREVIWISRTNEFCNRIETLQHAWWKRSKRRYRRRYRRRSDDRNLSRLT